MPVNEIITASAGSGKTFTLTGRLISLLADGVEPSKIVALTFTRAAAGEIFDSLAERLAKAAGSEQGAQEEAQRLMRPELNRNAFLQILRTLISQMHLSPIGTLDGFFVRIIRTFPYEFGVSGDFTVLDDHQSALERSQVFRRILQIPVDEEGEKQRQSFIEAFKRSTFGKEEKRLSELLNQYIEAFHDLYLHAPSHERWKLPGGTSFFSVEVEPDIAARELRRFVAENAAGPTQVQRWEAFISMAETFRPGSIVTKEGKDLFTKLLKDTDGLDRRECTVTVMRKKQDLSAEECRLARQLLNHIVHCMLTEHMETTAGIHSILHRYESTYARMVRSTGKLTFADVIYLLACSDDATFELSSSGTADNRLYIDYRLDGFFRHWALDEFQDTSRLQWAGISNLIDEVVQDMSGERSFFAVGDVKQAIYGWRGGDSRLLGEIKENYDLPARPLAESYRSCPPIIESVNRVFNFVGDVEDLPEATLDRWASIWTEHKSARGDLAGFCGVYEVCAVEEGKKPSTEDMIDTIAEQLLAVRPWERGLSAAVLVRANEKGKQAADHLKQRGIPAVWAGDKGVNDNPAVAALLSLIKYAEHPGDSFALEHLKMTPLAQTEPFRNPDDSLCRQLLQEVQDGYADFIELWTERLETVCRMDAFTRKRLKELMHAGRRFDRAGGGTAIAFIEYINSYTISDSAAADIVQVMTVHKSKGLGFDLVFLPLPAGNSGIDTPRADSVLIDENDVGGEINWLLHPPPKDVVLAEPSLRSAYEKNAVKYCFEELCLLYVALTRAKQGLYIHLPQPPKSGKSIHHHTLIRSLLAEENTTIPVGERTALRLYACGDPRWFMQHDLRKPSESESGERSSRILRTGRLLRLPRLLPSGTDHESTDAEMLFRRRGTESRDVGSLIHAFFEAVTWLDDAVPEDIVASRCSLPHPEHIRNQAANIFLNSLKSPEISALLSKPPALVTVWKEKRFEAIVDGRWVSGAFDRVTVQNNSSGDPVSAEIIDFKSDRITVDNTLETARLRHLPQLLLYRTVLAKLLNLSESAITLKLVFCSVGKVVT